MVRLFRRGKLRYPEDRAHSSPTIDGVVRELKNVVVHFNHRTISEFVDKMNLYTSTDAPLTVEFGKGGLRNRQLPRSLPRALIAAPLSVFWNRYVRHRGFRDGVHGFIVSVLMAFYQFVEYAKVWELRNVSSACQERPS